MGEFTIASLSAFDTFPTYIQYINETQAYPAAAVTLDELRDHVGGDALAAPHRAAGAGARCASAREVGQMAYLELQGLYRAFGPVVALQGIDLALEQGEFVSLLGPSGCGKTTALRLVAGFDRADAGRIVVDGRDLTRVPPNKRDMGMVFQAYSLFPNMTAAQNVEYGMRIRGKSKSDRQARAEELLELVGLGHAGSATRTSSREGCSSASRSLARSRSSRASSCSTSRSRRSTRRCGSSCARRSAASSSSSASRRIYVTHDQEEALAISDRVAVLHDGRIDQIGTPVEMYGAPATPFVAEFIGTMNRLASTVVADGVVEYAGQRLTVDAARGLPNGERVLVLVRPETVSIAPAADGESPQGAFAGEVVSQIFLGSVTRLRMAGSYGDGELTADLPTTHAQGHAIGDRVIGTFPSATGRLLSLAEQPDPAPAVVDPDDH